MRVAAVILAAGASTRLGEPKQLVVLAGETLLGRAVRIAVEAGCAPVVVVLGASAETVAQGCDLGAAEIVVHPAWQEGMASSIRVGIEAIAARAEGAIVMTCDQPAVTREHLAELMAAGRNGGEVVGSGYGKMRGVPAFFPGTRFRELLVLSGDSGARHLLAEAHTLALPGGEHDVDTPSALSAARAIYE